MAAERCLEVHYLPKGELSRWDGGSEDAHSLAMAKGGFKLRVISCDTIMRSWLIPSYQDLPPFIMVSMVTSIPPRACPFLLRKTDTSTSAIVSPKGVHYSTGFLCISTTGDCWKSDYVLNTKTYHLYPMLFLHSSHPLMFLLLIRYFCFPPF